MIVHVHLAQRSELRDAAYRLRYRVFVEEEGFELGAAHLNGKRFVDYWDTFDTTHSFVAVVDGRVVATLRGVTESALGLPDEGFFVEQRKALAPGRGCFMGRLAVEPAFRVHGLGKLLQEISSSYLRSIGVRYLFGLANLQYQAWWESLGYVWIGGPVHVPGVALELRAHYLDLQAATPRFSSVDYAGAPKLLTAPISWVVLQEGDTLCSEGEAPTGVWEILEGRLAVERGDPPRAIASLEPGELAGELGPLTRGPRTATVRACSRRVVAAAYDQERFSGRLASDADFTSRVLQETAGRLRHHLERSERNERT